jgi:hypothetical protein
VKLYVRLRQWAVDSKQANALGQGVQFHFLEGWFDMRDLGAVLDHEKLLPIGMRSIAPAKARRNANFRRSLTSPAY